MTSIRYLMMVMGVSLLAYSQEDKVTKTFEECIAYALDESQQLKVAKLEMDIAETQIGETLGRGLPQVSVAADFTYNPAVQQQILPDFLSPSVYGVLAQEGLIEPSQIPQGFGVAPVQFGTDFTSSATLNVSQLIFDGSYFVGVQAAKTLRELTAKQEKQTTIQVIEGVTKAFYLTLINNERIELIQSNLVRIDSLLRDTEALYQNGFAEKIDVQRIKVTRNNLKAEFDNLENLQKISYYALKTQMGMPVQTPLELDGTIENFTLDARESLDVSYDYQDRIEYSQVNTNILLSELDRRNNRTGYFPNLYAFGRFGYNSGFLEFDQLTDGDNWFGFAALGVNLSWTLFDGLQREYRMQRNSIQIDQLEEQKKQLENQIDTEVLQARASLQNALNNLQVQKENMELADEVYRTATLKYEEGVGSNLEVMDANNSLKEAQTNYYNALYNALVAKVDLEKSIGILDQN